MLTRQKRCFVLAGIILVLFAGLAIWSCCQGQIHFQSPAVTAKLVDKNTGQPLSGVKVIVQWLAARGAANTPAAETKELNSATLTTDASGSFTVPAWGPVTLGWGWVYFSSDPEISFPDSTDPGKVYNWTQMRFNEIRPWPFQTVTYELPSWNGQKIPR